MIEAAALTIGLADYADPRDAADVVALLDAYATGPFALLGRRHEATLGYNSERYRGQTLYGAQSDIANVPFGEPDRVPAGSVEPYVRGSGYETRQSGTYGQLRLSVTDPMTVVLGARVSRYATRSRSVAPSVRTDWAENTHESGQVTPRAAQLERILAVMKLGKRAALAQLNT